VNLLSPRRKPFFGNLRAMLLKKPLRQRAAMPGTGQTMSDTALQPMIRVASATYRNPRR
jgi:hypothetical protein